MCSNAGINTWDGTAIYGVNNYNFIKVAGRLARNFFLYQAVGLM
jgi:hypothetical protein